MFGGAILGIGLWRAFLSTLNSRPVTPFRSTFQRAAGVHDRDFVRQFHLPGYDHLDRGELANSGEGHGENPVDANFTRQSYDCRKISGLVELFVPMRKLPTGGQGLVFGERGGVKRRNMA